MVIILVCDDVSLPEEDKRILHQRINSTVQDKGFIAWLKNGSLTVGRDDLAQVLNTASTMMPQNSVQGQTVVPLHSVDERRYVAQPSEKQSGCGLGNAYMQQQQVTFSPATPAYTEHKTGMLLLKSKLRYGWISFEPADLAFLSPKFNGVSEVDGWNLRKQYEQIAETQVRIVLVPKDNITVIYCGDQGIEMADNDLLVLNTRVKKGLVSFHEDDVRFRYPYWKVPVHILEDLKSKASNGKLFIIFNEQGILRCKVQSGAMDRAMSLKDKASAFFSSAHF